MSLVGERGLPKARPMKEAPFSRGGHLRKIHAPIIVGLGMSSKMEQGWGNRLNEWSPWSELKILGCPLLAVSPQMDRVAALIRALTGEDVRSQTKWQNNCGSIAETRWPTCLSFERRAGWTGRSVGQDAQAMVTQSWRVPAYARPVEEAGTTGILTCVRLAGSLYSFQGHTF